MMNSKIIFGLLFAVAVIQVQSQEKDYGDEDDEIEEFSGDESEFNGTEIDDFDDEDDKYTFLDYFVHRVSGFHFAHEEDEQAKQDKLRRKPPRAPYLDTWKWKRGWKKYPLYLIILGGFRWDYLEAHKENLTSFSYMRRHGSAFPKVKPVFPPEDYPVWTSLATGLYPEEHNIIGDLMFNLKTREFFDRSDENTTHEADWWKSVQPFWSTAAKHGRKVAMFNWHDCNLPGKRLERQSDCRPYENPSDRIQSKSEISRMFDEAFNRLYKKHYDASVVYTDAIRKASEIHGPLSKEVYRVLHDIDDILQTKLIDIQSKDERAGIKMNLMVISDYGLTDDKYLEDIPLDEYLDMDNLQYIILNSGYATLIPYALTHHKVLHECHAIPNGVDVYLGSQLGNSFFEAEILPDYLHYGKAEWTQDILLVAKPGYKLVANTTVTGDKVKCVPGGGDIDDDNKARVGYNPEPEAPEKPKIVRGMKKTPELLAKIRRWADYKRHKDDMTVQGYAMGPDFKAGYEFEDEIEAVDFYQIMSFLLRIPAGHHSGSWERIAPMLEISAASQNSPHFVIIFFLLYSLVF